jgi:hypothetical protein
MLGTLTMTGVAMETAGVGVDMTGGMTRMPGGHPHAGAAGEGVLSAESGVGSAGWGGVFLQDWAGCGLQNREIVPAVYGSVCWGLHVVCSVRHMTG